MGANYTLGFATEGSNSDATAPSIFSVSADDFAIAVSFNEAVNSTDAVDLTKYSILAGSQTMTLSAMAGHSITYNAARKTAKIQGVRMPSGSSFSVTASNIQRYFRRGDDHLHDVRHDYVFRHFRRNA